MKLLLIEDDFFIAKNLILFLKKEGHSISWAKNGEQGLELALKENYHLIITDYLLPCLNGQEIIKCLRSRGYDGPILAISICEQTKNKVALLNEGADDYLTKPFLLDELRARITSLGRRRPANKEVNIYYDPELELNLAKRELICQRKKIPLTNKEFLLLKLLMSNPGQKLSYQEICERAWEEEGFNRHNLVEVYILKLREKLKFKKPSLIETVPGGYRWRSRKPQESNRFSFY